MYAWQGRIVHAQLASIFLDALKKRQSIDAKMLTEAAFQQTRRQFAFSLEKRYRQTGITKSATGSDFCALFEHEYGTGVSEDALLAMYRNVGACFESMVSQVEFLSELYAGCNHVAEERISFEMDGMIVTATPDLVFSRSDGGIGIVDWKVTASETSDYSRQLLIYALAIQSKTRADIQANDIHLYEMNLLKNRVQHHPVNTHLLEETEAFIYRSMVELRALIGNGRLEDVIIQDLDVAGSPYTCLHCNFRSLCCHLFNIARHTDEVETIQGRLL